MKKEETKGQITQLVSFSVDREEYAVPVLKIMEILRMPDVTRVPNTPPYVEGVMNLRGKVIPLVSLRKRLNMTGGENSRRTRAMVIDVTGELMGFVVDSVSEVLRVAESEILPPPAAITGGVQQECISGVINKGERLLILLDLEKLIKEERGPLAE